MRKSLRYHFHGIRGSRKVFLWMSGGVWEIVVIVDVVFAFLEKETRCQGASVLKLWIHAPPQLRCKAYKHTTSIKTLLHRYQTTRHIMSRFTTIFERAIRNLPNQVTVQEIGASRSISERLFRQERALSRSYLKTFESSVSA
jgi:hypothetical protein